MSNEGIRVATVDDIPVGEGIVIEKTITGTDDNIAVLRDDDGSVYALDDTCPHEVASLAEGWVEDGYVECPLHSSKFCLKSGEVQCLPATESVRPHRIEVHDGQVFLFPNEAP